MRLTPFLALGAAALFSLEDNEKLSPAQRVVKLLGEMKTQLEEEAKKDAEMAEKLQCWCKTNTAEKEKAIKDGDAKTDELVSIIEENSARKAKMDATIKQQKKEIAALRDSLQKAEEIRAKEQEAFRASDVELVKTITNLKMAIQVLGKHNAGLLQIDQSLTEGLQSVLHAANEKHIELFGKSGFDPKAHTSFLQANTGVNAIFLQSVQPNFEPTISEKYGAKIVSSFAQTSAPHLDGYSSQSGQIFGIINSMKDNFEANLSDGQKEEMAAVEAFKQLKSTLNSQIDATSKALANSKAEFADSSKKLADAKEELEETRDVRAADVEFLRNLKVTCGDIDNQWALRQKERADETAAVGEAISILTSDDNRELLAKTVSFAQIRSNYAKRDEVRSAAAKVLREASRKAPSWDDLSFQWAGSRKPQSLAPKQQLATLAVTAQLDAFTKVKEAMDAMVTEIKTQMAEDVKHRDFCNDEFKKNDRETTSAKHDKEDAETKIDDLASQIEGLVADIKDANAQVAETRTQIKKAGEDREAENKMFQDSVAEQRATQIVLKKALDRLNEYYSKKAMLLQTKQTPPGQFQPYRKSGGASPVLTLLNTIVEDSKAIEGEAIKDEQESQSNYEQFVADSNNTVKKLNAEIATNTESKANKEGEKVQTEESLASTNTSIENLSNYRADLHGSCDFVVANFEVRQQAMTNEIEAIGEAKAILSGAK
jgi:peptidoglycan hydrolase CwlO-like protein